MKRIFEIKNASVNFDKHSITHKTLRYALGAKINGHSSEKTSAIDNVSLVIYEGIMSV